jgi:hypothetical protein
MIEVLNKFGKLVKMITTAREDALFRVMDRSVRKTINPIDVAVVRSMPIPGGMEPNVPEWVRREWYSHDGCCKSGKLNAHPCWKSMSKRAKQYKNPQPSVRIINDVIYYNSYCRKSN